MRIAAILLVILLIGCASYTIEEIKSEEYIGEEITVTGTVEGTIKIGDLSGFKLVDETGEIRVSSEELPAEGEKMTIRGTVMKDTIFGYYIKR